MKKTNLNPLEIALNQIYNEPDLSSPVMNFITPYLAKAYALVSMKKFDKQAGTDTNNNNNANSFLNGDEKNQLESILYKELPILVDLYIKYPVEYRNTEVLKTGKTLRETLLINLSILMAKMEEIEKNQYEELNTTTIVKTNIIQNKYASSNFIENINTEKNSATQLEKETNELIQATFDVSNFKKLSNQDNFKNLQNSIPENFIKNNKNEIIRLKEGQIEYKVKDKMRAFMSGSYQAYVSASKLSKKFIAPITTSAVVGIVGGVIGFGSIYAMKAWYSEKDNPSQRSASKIYEDVRKYIAASTLDTRDLNIILLEKYSKTQPRLHFKLSEDKEVVEVTVDVNKEQCKDAISDFKTRLVVNSYEYKINDVAIQTSSNLSDELIGEICSKETNKTKIGYYTVYRNR